MRKGFLSCPPESAETPVFDSVSAFVPDQSLSLRDMMLQFAYIGSERMEEILNRGFIGDEDDDNGGYMPGALDFAEIHDRLIQDAEVISSAGRVVHAPQPQSDPEPEPEPDPDEEATER